MAYPAARMILKDKRRKTSKEDYPKGKSKVCLIFPWFRFQHFAVGNLNKLGIEALVFLVRNVV